MSTMEIVTTQAGGFDIEAAEVGLAKMRSREDADAISQVRAAADAQAVFERSRGHAEEARKYATLKVLAEAEIGIMLLDEAISRRDLDPPLHQHTSRAWKTLAAAHERGVLREECDAFDDGELTTTGVARYLRDCGYDRVPASCKLGDALNWSEARRRATEEGVPLHSLPPDRKGRGREIKRARANMSARNKAAWAAYRSDPNRTLRDGMADRDKAAQPELERAYALLRRTQQACDKSLPYCRGEACRSVNEALDALYLAEERVLRALGQWVPEPSGAAEVAARLSAVVDSQKR